MVMEELIIKRLKGEKITINELRKYSSFKEDDKILKEVIPIIDIRIKYIKKFFKFIKEKNIDFREIEKVDLISDYVFDGEEEQLVDYIIIKTKDGKKLTFEIDPYIYDFGVYDLETMKKFKELLKI